jgi:transcriptional regulator with GAF, ATPase, and Fis domain
MEQTRHVARALAEAAREINAPRDLQHTLDTIVQTATSSIPGIDHVGIAISHRDGKVETMAATDPFVWDLDEMQYELGEGPCLDAIWKEPVLRVEHARHEQRWPRYIPKAVERGLRAQLGLRLYVDEATLGGLNMYSTESDTIDPEAQEIAELFASHAALALGRARREEQLNSALYTRKIIGQAIGMVMERYQLDEDRAFQYLTRVSQASNIKLREVAAELVRMRNGEFAQGGSS